MFRKIEQIRQQKNMSIKELCLRTDIKVRTYHNWKSNKSSPTVIQFNKMCKVLDTKINIYTIY